MVGSYNHAVLLFLKPPRELIGVEKKAIKRLMIASVVVPDIDPFLYVEKIFRHLVRHFEYGFANLIHEDAEDISRFSNKNGYNPISTISDHTIMDNLFHPIMDRLGLKLYHKSEILSRLGEIGKQLGHFFIEDTAEKIIRWKFPRLRYKVHIALKTFENAKDITNVFTNYYSEKFEDVRKNHELYFRKFFQQLQRTGTIHTLLYHKNEISDLVYYDYAEKGIIDTGINKSFQFVGNLTMNLPLKHDFLMNKMFHYIVEKFGSILYQTKPGLIKLRHHSRKILVDYARNNYYKFSEKDPDEGRVRNLLEILAHPLRPVPQRIINNTSLIYL